MIYTLDKELKGHALQFNGPLDLVKAAAHANSPEVIEKFDLQKRYGYQVNHGPQKGQWRGSKCFWPDPSTHYAGRKGKTWDDILGFMTKPWPQARKLVDDVLEACANEKMPTPRSRKRKPRWSDVDGEVDTDRALRGEPEYLRRVQRECRVGPTHIALICNLDCPGNCNSTGVFWRSAAAVAATDILENLGYSVEICMWCRGYAVYERPYHNQFVTCRIKDAGDPVNKDSLCDALSSWFTSEGIFAAFAAAGPTHGVWPVSVGGADTKEPGPWEKYMDVTHGVQKVYVPSCYGSVKDAMECAKKILRIVIAEQETLV